MLNALPLEGGRVVPKSLQVQFDSLEVFSGPNVRFGSSDEPRSMRLPQLGLERSRVDASAVRFTYSVHGQKRCLCVEASGINSGCHLTNVTAGIRGFPSYSHSGIRVGHVERRVSKDLGFEMRKKRYSVSVLDVGRHGVYLWTMNE